MYYANNIFATIRHKYNFFIYNSENALYQIDMVCFLVYSINLF